MRKGSRHKARCAAVQALYQWQLTRQDPSEIEQYFLHDRDMKDVDLEYFHQLVREVPQRVRELDARLVPYLDRDIEEVDPVERAILRLGAYEFEFHPEIPGKVVLDEAVELAKTFGAEQGHKYVNAVLDKLAARLRPHELRVWRDSSS